MFASVGVEVAVGVSVYSVAGVAATVAGLLASGMYPKADVSWLSGGDAEDLLLSAARCVLGADEAVLVEAVEPPVVRRSVPQGTVFLWLEGWDVSKLGRSLKVLLLRGLSFDGMLLARGLGSTRSLLKGGIAVGRELAREDMAGKRLLSGRVRLGDMREGL